MSSRPLAMSGRRRSVSWPGVASLARGAVSMPLAASSPRRRDSASANHAPSPAAAWALRALALGELNAVGDLTDVERAPDLLRFHMGRADALADIVEALVALGRLQDAEKVLVTVDEEARNGQLWAAPAVLRCRALILLGRGDAAPAVLVAEEAATGFEILGFPLDHGRPPCRGRCASPVGSAPASGRQGRDGEGRFRQARRNALGRASREGAAASQAASAA